MAPRDSVSSREVAVAYDPALAGYPCLELAPYHPSGSYPECPFEVRAAEPNPVYEHVRNVLRDLGLDAEHFGTSSWNPLGDLVAEGASILVKPNWVMHENHGPGGTDCLVTHASVLRAVLDYVVLAKPRRIVVGDAPLQGCDFASLMNLGFESVIRFMKQEGVSVECRDFRRTVLVRRGASVQVREDLRPLEQYVLVDLGAQSLLEPIGKDSRKFRVTMYDPRKMFKQHRPGRHRYLVAREVLEADLVVNLPKLKTHKKAGVTAALKNLVGINGNKDYLPHHRKGPPVLGGDNYERFSLLKLAAEQILDFANRQLDREWLYGFCNRLVYYLLVTDKRLGGSGEVEGSWYGNDTVWRMCLDLNRILLYADVEGRFHEEPCRTEISIADGVIGGQGQGPLSPDPVSLQVLVGALNPAVADWCSALLMGFRPERIPIIQHAFEKMSLPITCFSPEEAVCKINGERLARDRVYEACGHRVASAAGWRGHIESEQLQREVPTS